MALPRSSKRARVLGWWTTVSLVAALVLAGGTHALATPGDEGLQTSAPESDGAGTLAGSDLDVRQGEQAVDHLERTGTLDEVAATAGLEADELIEELIEDPSTFVTDSGFVGYADTLDRDHEHHDDEGRHDDDGHDDEQHLDAGPGVTSAQLTAAALPANVLDLHSRPMSTRVLYLDFDGHSANDPAWAGVAPPGPIVSAPFDIDGVPGFSAAEQTVIHEVWQRVAEDYRAFDINVTTRDPGIEGIRRASIADASYGQRMVISPSNFTLMPGVIGVALLNVFGSDVDHAAYVFTDSGFKQLSKTIGEAVSHEAGHTFGLRHDGVRSVEYYAGHGAWAPIMGFSVNASTPVTQWSRGEYADANRQEDDLAIIADGNFDSFGRRLTPGVGYRPDDHGDTPASATVVPSNSVTSGNIGRTGDRDVFAVDVLDGSLSVQLAPPAGEAAWSNLAATLTIRNSAGAVVASAGPTVPSGWAIDLAPSVPAGRYTLEVGPVGWLTASTGFTTYGSLGAYQLAVSAPQGAPPPGAGASTFTPVTPVRLVDSRNGVGATGRIGSGRQIVVQVAGTATVPPTATAAIVNVAAVNPSSPGFVTVYPCSDSVPDTSTLNYVEGQTVANTTIAALSSAGQLCVWSFADTDILVDITGWIGPGGSSRLTPIGPTRVVDTRSGVGGLRLGAGATMAVNLNGIVPAGSTAVALNVTGVTATAPGFITVYPCSGSVPNTSTINYVAGEARPNNTIVGLSGGQVCIYSDQATEILVDLLGAFGPSGLAYQPTPPVRVLDTRTTGTPGAGGAVGYAVGAAGLAGQTPGAAYVNVTAANHLVPGYVTTYDCVTRRDTSTLNQRVGQANANGAIVPLSALQSCAWTFGGGDLIVDLNGWWVP